MDALPNLPLPFVASIVILALCGAYIYTRHRNTFLKKLQGPESSFLLGNELDIRYQNEVGDVEFKWMQQFGSAWRRRGPLGRDHLMIADPKAAQYILHTSGYHFPKKADQQQNTKMILGEGLVWAPHGEIHQRQRKIMTPAFFAPQLRTFLPLFQDSASKLAQKWKDDVIALDQSGTPVVNVARWLSRVTLDVIGEAGFDYHFGSLDDAKPPLANYYDNLFIDSTLYPSKFDMVFRSLWRFVPAPVLHYVRYLPMREYRRFREYLDFVRVFARDLIEKSSAKSGGKDILSILLQANQSEDPKGRLSDQEAIDQISTLLLAGHDTTANSLTWFLWEIAKHPEDQTRVREEIAAVRARRNEEQFSAAGLDSMTFTQAALKESMRLHPIVWILPRQAGRDDVVPLAFPITLKSGEQVSSVPIKKGTPIDISIAAYNRNPEIWGPDAGEWNPDRFLNMDKAKQTSVGVFANLLNFSGGIRACIGWRFSVLEMQIIAATLLENFEFSLPPNSEKMRIYRKPTGIMVPMTDGERGAWMGLAIKALK
ncbi:cytochrome P450 [Gloeopeniophorella convolvens]|nr:cytochrome P450 [Gloeopeniophorella convolvens]